MSADIWFKRDIQNALVATAMAGMEAGLYRDAEYMRGFCSAVRMLSLMFGIAPTLVLPAEQAMPQLLESER